MLQAANNLLAGYYTILSINAISAKTDHCYKYSYRKALALAE